MGHFKKLYCALMLTLLVGCGGGSGGGSSSSANSEDTVTRYSSDYAASDLRVFFALSVTSPSEAEIEGYVQDSSFNYVAINGGDQLVAEVDSLNFSLAETSAEGGVYYYGGDVSASASEYIVKLLRGDVVQSSLAVNELPLPFTLTTSFAGEVIDVSWAPEADHTYSYLVETLTCKNSIETNIRTVSPDINAGEHLLNSGSYNKSLSEVFGQTQAQLTQGFDSCIFEMDIIASKDSLPSQTNGQLTFDVVQKRKLIIEL
ncbi:hypothetical protein AB4562_27160 [Vibrio sp. 10N.222.54.A1]|uniref:hypothetical protein n=1 Tax=unclassified Vibrio TaxID=2614977 RepID=UPI000C84F847|nr:MULTISPECIES: hypothetical protein [unclassified Vibrio]PMK77679.1 hypothetical protein BCT92_20580 [Vibrio sp. 10N.261.52.E5]TKF85231.1 hypothetical protein FCV65_02460 [Vibrio sp. F13]